MKEDLRGKREKIREKIVVNQKLAFYINNGLMYSYPHIVVKYEDDINTQLPIPAVWWVAL